MTDPIDLTATARQLMELQIEHRDLDALIDKLSADIAVDQLQIKRMKKRKLKIKDMIAFYQSRLIPDLDA
ncbi:MAG: DUF465 domain-containing protein [Lysobacterales bacterium CG02_land_8_20_14_3_00_62_12]|nr:MAG: DUF465 domain-containing protein [Xanthomonadales bacterium CG02_land_8_20_14_3_00_62_12]